MAIKDVTSGRTLSNVLTIDTNATASDLSSAISMKLAHVDAIAVAIYGGGFAAFNGLNAALKENYLWAISEQVSEIRVLFEAYASASISRSQ